jgi:Sec-independent protein translocase protein TatA
MDDKLARTKKIMGHIRRMLELIEERRKMVDGEENESAKEKEGESEEESLVSKSELDVISEETRESEEGDGLK